MTQISNQVLVNKALSFIQQDPKDRTLRALIRDAVVSAEREIRNIDRPSPLAWLREHYNELFTRSYAAISAITQADPGVITAESSHEDITDNTGFSEDDLVYIDGVYGMERLNRRVYRYHVESDTTCSLKQLHDQIDIDTTDYEEYVSGGYLYHVGLKLPASNIEPSGDTASYNWDIGSVFGVTFDLEPADPISEEALLGDSRHFNGGIGRPNRWRYQRYGYGTLGSSPEHFLHFWPPANQIYNIAIAIEKSYPDIAVWNAATYPPHIPEVHDAIWHRALSNLATNAEKQRRETAERTNTGVEVLYAQHWMRKALEDEIMIQGLSRRMLGGGPSCGPRSGIRA